MKLAELVIVLIFVVLPQIPMFVFANSIDYDEWLKSGTGAAVAGTVILVYRTWLGRESQEPPAKPN